MLALQDRLEGLLERQRETGPCLRRVAAAAGAAPDIADLVAAALDHAGADGVVEVRRGLRREAALRQGDGFVLDAECISPWLGPPAGETILELPQVHVLVADDIVAALGRLASVLDGFASRAKALVIVARGVTGPALATLVRNRREADLRVTALRPRDVAGRAAAVLEDLAVATGAMLVAERFGLSLDALRPGMLGRADRLVLARGQALFAAPGGQPEAVRDRRRLILAEVVKYRDLAYDREHLERRAGRLHGRWAEIEVDGGSGGDGEQRLAAARAALGAARAARAGGVVPGGGLALSRIADVMAREAAALPVGAAAPIW